MQAFLVDVVQLNSVAETGEDYRPGLADKAAADDCNLSACRHLDVCCVAVIVDVV